MLINIITAQRLILCKMNLGVIPNCLSQRQSQRLNSQKPDLACLVVPFRDLKSYIVTFTLYEILNVEKSFSKHRKNSHSTRNPFCNLSRGKNLGKYCKVPEH